MRARRVLMTRLSMALLVGSLAIPITLSGCGARVTVPPLTPADAALMSAAANELDADYRLEPGDRIEIRFPFHPELDQEDVIRPDGRIGVKRAGELAVAGLTASEVETLVAARTSDRLRDPSVRVTVVEFSPKSVYVTGEVGAPGLVSYRKGLTPLAAIVEAGGFSQTALVDSVILIRSAGPDGQFVSRTLDLQEALTRGAEEPLSLAPYDVVFVPRTRIADVDIWIDQHFTQLLPFVRGTGARFPLGF